MYNKVEVGDNDVFTMEEITKALGVPYKLGEDLFIPLADGKVLHLREGDAENGHACEVQQNTTVPDVEAWDIMSDLPKVGRNDGNGKPNAFVALSKDGKRLEIFPTGGGWLGCDADKVVGDMAPFCD